eukprot:13183499-Ditylum_brightwellii.AAC.1
MNDIYKSKETTSDTIYCDGMPELEPAKDDDASYDESSIEDIWKGCVMEYINNVKRNEFGGN